MSRFFVRFNKTRGQHGRGTEEHVWRIFENEVEYLARHVQIQVPSWTEKDANGVDYNIVCQGKMLWFSDTDTAVIVDAE